MNAPAGSREHSEIIAALPLRQRPGLYIDPAPDARGNLTVMERYEDPDDGPGESIVGLAARSEDGWYLGCIRCRAEIDEAAGGMCRPCRKDLAREDLMHVRDEPEFDPPPAPDREDY
jgi:hypothetical protein